MSDLARGLAQEKAMLRRRREHAPAAPFLDQCREVRHGIETEDGELEAVLPFGLTVAAAAVTAELGEQVKKMGFTEVWDFGPEEANARYCANRSDRLRLRIAHFTGARV